MGDGSDGTDVSPESETVAAEKSSEIWGTLEELLLACAVTRHGTSSWDSVAMAVQTRSPLAARPGLTPRSCRLRFRHLHRRFSTAGSGGEEEVEAGDGEEDPDASAAEGWVDELRRLRVAELRRDVERCDLSIGTLQSKVKRLREERERSLSGEAKPDEASGNDRLSGEEPGRSCRESNSTDLKPPEHPGGVKEEEVAKQEASGESAAASKESSDVRSSASLCRRRRGKGSGADEEEAASAPCPPPAQSPPLAALLDAVAAKLGPVMERLREHETEEGAAYRGTIRRHVDLESVRCKLEASTSNGSRDDDDDGYYYPASEFYRDLLLLCTNAIVFFPRAVPEHAAAVEARALVCEHAAAVLREPKQEHVVAASTPAPGPAPASGDIVGPLIEKVKPLIVCRKRSSIAKAAAMKKESTEKSEAEKEQLQSEDEEEAVAAAPKEKSWGMRTKKRGGAVRRLAGTRLTDDTSDGAKKADKKAGAAAGSPAKKRNAVDFLKRLNQGSSPTKKRGSPLGTTRRRLAAEAAEEQPKTRKRGTGRKDGTGRGGGTKRGGRGGGAKRGVGRPLKRGGGPVTPPPAKRAKTSRSDKPATGKRGGRRSVG
ncbi:hypothetical protein PR202_ga15430 [Eleusine coracana subsp. coracana]|uniref:Myb-like domain-containing protein n=1 Tax=Eleusine coracana subsp. coracana TaxID=191504 RepID=A0AAV5CK61_ELECO|nr:hypothetical protein PR202_ga15430 [Eleusine coracana subsp. coracana]